MAFAVAWLLELWLELPEAGCGEVGPDVERSSGVMLEARLVGMKPARPSRLPGGRRSSSVSRLGRHEGRTKGRRERDGPVRRWVRRWSHERSSFRTNMDDRPPGGPRGE